jgi:hypothetical protein
MGIQMPLMAILMGQFINAGFSVCSEEIVNNATTSLSFNPVDIIAQLNTAQLGLLVIVMVVAGFALGAIGFFFLLSCEFCCPSSYLQTTNTISSSCLPTGHDLAR